VAHWALGLVHSGQWDFTKSIIVGVFLFFIFLNTIEEKPKSTQGTKKEEMDSLPKDGGKDPE